jgi:hypothetical protein
MSQTSRRIFLMQVAACGSVLAAARAQADVVKLDEKDAQAVALGFVLDTNKADVKKFPKHVKEQKCSGCALFQGKPTDAAAPCTLFALKQVPAGGWCSAWAKKP